ncbi:MAG: efflux transporter outer membrane subunit [Planctomycetota bacterium]|jgi:multidrug efflux system outer membrane protein
MKKLLTSIFWLFLTVSIVMLTGCMVGPKYSRPETAADSNEPFVHSGNRNQDVNDLEMIDSWWEQFGDPTTTALVLRALENNYDLKAAAARVLQAQAALDESRGRLWPDVSYGLSRDRSKRSFTFGSGFGGGERFSIMSTTWSQDISVVYVVDLFGKLRHAERAAWADMLAAQATEQALVNSIIATVVKARIDVATIQKRLAIARANTESRTDTLEIVERKYSRGLVKPVEIRLARENLEAAKSLEPAIELSLIRAQNALDVLLGHRPAASEPLPETLPELPDLEPVSIGLPASLLDRRPDVIAAELTLRAANERIGVSIAQLFPDLILTASTGRSADEWEDIWIDETETYSALIRLAQPIFKGGQLKARIDAAEARYAELAANYAGTVLTAMREVEDALAAEQMLQDQLEHAQSRFIEAEAAERLSKQRYSRGVAGVAGFLTVLETQRRRRIAEEQVAILKGQIWTTRVNLFLALGGDWTDKEEAK